MVRKGVVCITTDLPKIDCQFCHRYWNGVEEAQIYLFFSLIVPEPCSMTDKACRLRM